MSVGNLKDEGNQGKNFPWQLKMLLGQQCACDQLTQIAGNTDDVEFLLSAILTTLQASTEYEAKFVVDTCNADTVYLEVRVWNPDTSTWGPITYYIPGSATPVVPPGAGTPGCLQYTDPSGVLAMILAELQSQTTILTDIDTNTDGIETQLANILTAYGAGQKACASSFSVTLCTEQGNTLASILAELQSTLDVNITNATLAVTQSGAWTVTANQGTTPWTVAGTVALDAATLAALETITVLQGTSPWTVNGTVNAAQSGTWTVALDAATLLALETITVQQGTSPWVVSGTVNIGTMPEVEIKNDSGNPIPVTLPTGTNNSYYDRAVGYGIVVSSGAKSISVQNIGNDNITMITDSSPSTIIDPGVSITFDAEVGKTLGGFSFLHSSVNSLYIVTQVR
jgi:hypothetical protein